MIGFVVAMKKEAQLFIKNIDTEVFLSNIITM